MLRWCLSSPHGGIRTAASDMVSRWGYAPLAAEGAGARVGGRGDHGQAKHGLTTFTVQLAIVASAVAATADHELASLPLLLVVLTAAVAPGFAIAIAALHVTIAALAGAPVDLVASMCGAMAGIVLTPNKALLAATVVWASLTASVLFAVLAAGASLWWGAVPTVVCAGFVAAGRCFTYPVSVVGPKPSPPKDVEHSGAFLY